MEFYRGFKIGGYALSDDEEAELARLETIKPPVLVFHEGSRGEGFRGSHETVTASTLEDEVRELFSDTKQGYGESEDLPEEDVHINFAENAKAHAEATAEDRETEAELRSLLEESEETGGPYAGSSGEFSLADNMEDQDWSMSDQDLGQSQPEGFSLEEFVDST